MENETTEDGGQEGRSGEGKMREGSYRTREGFWGGPSWHVLRAQASAPRWHGQEKAGGQWLIGVGGTGSLSQEEAH